MNIKNIKPEIINKKEYDKKMEKIENDIKNGEYEKGGWRHGSKLYNNYWENCGIEIVDNGKFTFNDSEHNINDFLKLRHGLKHENRPDFGMWEAFKPMSNSHSMFITINPFGDTVMVGIS